MRKYGMLGLVASLMFSLALIAQGQPQQKNIKGNRGDLKKEVRKDISPEKKAEFMATQLGLTDAEKFKVQDLFIKQDAKSKKHMQEAKKLREEQKANYEAERTARDAELVKIIGNEKFQKLQSLRIAQLEKTNRMYKMKLMQKSTSDHNQHHPMMDRMNNDRMKKVKEKEL